MSDQDPGWISFEDGSQAYLTADNEVVEAIDPAGEPDPDLWAYVDALNAPAEPEPESYEDPVGAELLERQAALEQQIAVMNERSQEQLYVPTPRSSDAIVADMHHQAAYIEGMLGRPMTDRERHVVATRAIASVEAGDERVDLLQAAAELGDMGEGPLIEATGHEGRTRLMTEILQDAERAERGEMYGAPPARQREEYDTSTSSGDRGHAARVALAMDTINGYDDVQDQRWDSSAPAYEEEMD